MSKKYLRKNEFRMDFNPNHQGKNKEFHPAYITAKYGHKYKANTITHSRKTTDNRNTLTIDENPNKLSKDKRRTRISPPFWQHERQFGKEKLTNFRFSRKTRKRIKKINKKFK